MNTSQRLARIEKALPVPSPPNPYARYRDDPAGFARDVLRVTWTPTQREIAESLLRPPYRTLVKASHNVGKTMVSAGVALWWHLTRSPSIVISTAPKLEQVRDLLWKEVRRQCRGLVSFAGPRIPRVDRGPDDFMVGTTAQSGTAFQGHHGPSMLFIFDEGVGVDPEFWQVTETMFAPPGHAWLVIFNPTDSASPAYQAEMARDAQGNPTWNVITMSALDHPNVAAELDGQAPPVPSAIRLGRLDDMLAEWCEPVAAGTQVSTDVEWPPGSGNWLRPGPLAEARLLGRWPSQAAGVWSDALWRGATAEAPDPSISQLPQVGCDVARFGDDYTAIHSRCGDMSLAHESHNGWSTSQTAGRLKQVCRELAGWQNARQDPAACKIEPEEITVRVDDDGVGGGVVDQADGYRFVPISAAASSSDPDGYPNRRSELWFALAARARAGKLSLARLPREVQHRLRQQAMAPAWKLDAAGRRVVEPKDVTKAKLGRSPDDMDAANLAYLELPAFDAPRGGVPQPKRSMEPQRKSAAGRRGLFGARE